MSANTDLFDLVIIGGGINGVAIARDAALRGLKVVLLEKEDFGSGASTKSSKLAHGGVRYLEQFQFGLVRESLRERALLLKNAPHLVKPLPFVLPVYAGDPHALWQINLGLFLYDHLGGQGALPKHRKLKRDEVLGQFPGINSKDLRGGCFYCDAQMLDNRIVIENILSAASAGAIVKNYAEVTGLILQQGRVCGVHVRHALSGQTESIYGKIVVNATGAWSSQITEMLTDSPGYRMAPTKGVHLVMPKIAGETALLLHAPQDKRVFFILPWGEYSLVGTTDTFYSGNPDEVAVENADYDYILTALQHYYPAGSFRRSDVLAAFAGLRPLVDFNGLGNPSDIIREHYIHASKAGMVTIVGGKYTTHRHVAEQVVDEVVKKIGQKGRYSACSTATTPLPGASGTYSLEEVKRILSESSLEKQVAEHLLGTYGTASLDILKIVEADPSQGLQICTTHPHIFGELTYAVNVEHAKTLEDWFCRRTSIAYTACRGVECLAATAKAFAKLRGWTQEQLEEEIDLYDLYSKRC